MLADLKKYFSYNSKYRYKQDNLIMLIFWLNASWAIHGVCPHVLIQAHVPIYGVLYNE